MSNRAEIKSLVGKLVKTQQLYAPIQMMLPSQPHLMMKLPGIVKPIRDDIQAFLATLPAEQSAAARRILLPSAPDPWTDAGQIMNWIKTLDPAKVESELVAAVAAESN